MPNTFAYLVLYSWPIVVIVLFRTLPKAQALIASILGGYLILPYAVGIDPPILPSLDKTLIPAFSAAVMCLLLPDAPGALMDPDAPAPSPAAAGPEAPARRGARPARPAAAARAPFTRQAAPRDDAQAPATGAPAGLARRGAAAALGRGPNSKIGTALIVLLLFAPFVTVLNNGAPYVTGVRVIRGLSLHDALSMALNALIMILPFLLGRRYLATPRQHRLLLRGLCIAGLLYSLPTLFEWRMSPQLSRWVYGFLAQSFGQAMRDGGFRPVVFLEHGLWLAIFLAMTILAAVALWRETRAAGKAPAGRWLLAGAWLLLTLVLCHSLGALIEALVLLPLVLFVPVRGQLIFASVIAAVILAYPVLRGSGIVPTQQIVDMANAVSANRAQSLEFRLRNEDRLLAHADVKPLAGWGGWGRSRLFDPYSGKDITVTDGEWIITVGEGGWLGYLARFGLLAAPIFLLAFRRRQLGVGLATSGLALVLAANLIDMIPNATLTPVTWLIAGALMGRLTVPDPAGAETRPARASGLAGRRAAAAPAGLRARRQGG